MVEMRDMVDGWEKVEVRWRVELEHRSEHVTGQPREIGLRQGTEFVPHRTTPVAIRVRLRLLEPATAGSRSDLRVSSRARESTTGRPVEWRTDAQTAFDWRGRTRPTASPHRWWLSCGLQWSKAGKIQRSVAPKDRQ